jgi:hypothetical protein
MLAIGVSHGEQTWVITCSGPKSLMKKHVEDFDQFVGALGGGGTLFDAEAEAEAGVGVRLEDPEAETLVEASAEEE